MAGFDRLVKEMARLYNFEGDLTKRTYEEQIRDPDFIKVLTFNCLVMDSLNRCCDFETGCEGCKAAELFGTVTDPALRKWIDGRLTAIRAGRAETEEIWRARQRTKTEQEQTEETR